MSVPVLIAVLLFVLPKTPPDSALKGWEREDVVALPYATACQRLSADLATDGWRLVRTERLGEGVRVQEIRKFANARGETVIFRLWRIGTSATGYAYRRDLRGARLEKGAPKSSKHAGTMKIGVDTLPALPKDATDRNRTSPFAFTGNKFEFRAPGSLYKQNRDLLFYHRNTEKTLAGPCYATRAALASE